MTDYGVDVSAYNTISNWSSVRTVNSWAWAKATQGSGYTSSAFAAQMAGGQKAGVAMGAYHFPDPRVSVATNVAHFVSIARSSGAFAKGAFLPMLDMENSAGDGITWSAAGANGFIPAFRDALRSATGVQQLCVYGPESWWASGFLQPGRWADSNVFLCAAQYSGVPGQLGWSHPRLAVHQYTDAAPTPGAATPTDRSVILPPFTLSQLTIGGTVSPSTATTQEDDDMPYFHYVRRQSDGSYGRAWSTGRFDDSTSSGLSATTVAQISSANGVIVENVDDNGWSRYIVWGQEAEAALKADAIPQAGGSGGVTAVPTAWLATNKGAGVTEIKAEQA